jgi:hypothetical protein
VLQRQSATVLRDSTEDADFRAMVLRLHFLEPEPYKEDTMATKSKGRIKNKKKYEALKDKGYSKTRAAKIANSGKEGSRKGGKHSHK